MTKQKLQQLFMLQILLSFCKTNQTKVDLVAMFKSGVNTITGLVTQILSLLGPQSRSVAGGGSAKQQARERLNRITFTIITIVKGYALNIKNQDLATEMSLSLRDIQKISDKKIISTANDFITLIQPLLTQLAPWGIRDSTIQSWTQAIDAYNSTLLLPATKRKNKVNTTDEMDALLAQAMDNCKSILDTTINIYPEMGETKFANQYKTFRQQTPIATRHTRLEAVVTDELNNPFINCTVTVDGFTKKGKVYQAVSAQTDINGKAIVSEFEPGIRTVTVSGDKIQTRTFDAINFHIAKTIQQVYVCAHKFDNIPASKVEATKEMAVK